MLYEDIKINYCVKGQTFLRMPKSEGNEIIMVSPSVEATYKIINDGYTTFFKDGIRAYVTDTKINRKMGPKVIKVNGISEFRKDYMESVKNRSIKFYSSVAMAAIEEKKDSFIFDTGRMHNYYMQNRYAKRNADYLCKDYMTMLMSLIGEVGEGYNKILYISVDAWLNAGAIIGIGNDMMNNPISILYKCMMKYPDMIGQLSQVCSTVLFVNEVEHEFIKLKLPDGNGDPNSLSAKDTKALYQKLKIQMARMTLTPSIPTTVEPKVITTTDTHAESSVVEAKPAESTSVETKPIAKAKLPASTENVANIVKKEMLSEESVLDTINKQDIADILDEDLPDEDAEENTEVNEINEEIKDVIDEAVNSIPELTSADVSDSEKKTILENEVKKKVYLSKFVPERTKKQMEYIEVNSTKQARALSQSVATMKSKIIDENTVSSDVVETRNEAIKHVKYANADKCYVEKKYIPDVNNAVAKMSEGDVKVFIESIDEEDTSDQMNQKKTLTYHLVDEFNKKHTIVIDVPIIRDGCHLFIGGSNKLLLHQRIPKPIVKIRPDAVQIITFYNKVQINRYGKATTPAITALKKYITKHSEKYKARFGNAGANNLKYKTSLEFDDFARTFTEVTVNDTETGDKLVLHFDLSVAEKIANTNKLPIGITKSFTTDSPAYIEVIGKDGTLKTMEYEDVASVLLKHISAPEISSSIAKGNGKFIYARAKILNSFIPVALFCLFCEGWSDTARKCEIEYKFLPSTTTDTDINLSDYSFIQLQDGKLLYKTSNNIAVDLFMNGLRGLGLETYTFEELDSKDTYIDILSNFYENANQAFNLDKFRMFLIDNKTKEILEDFDLPTDIVEVFYYTCKLLATNQCLSENDMRNVRIRSNEIIPQITYQYVVEAYSRYYRTCNNRRPEHISVPRDAVIKALLSSSLLDEDSVINPIYELEKTRATTIAASTSAKNITLTGINKVDGYGMDKRAYDETMVGVFGLTSPADANVGIVRDLALEPNITSTNGYIEVTPMDDIDSLVGANLFTAVELLTPPGVMHDDPQRSAMMRGQTSKMVMTDGSSPVLMGNKVESIVPYHLNNDYCFVAKDNGTVVDERDGVYVIQYKNDTYESFDTNDTVRKNASDGCYTRIKFDSKVKVGDKFKKDEVIAADKTAFTFNKYDRGASCNIGVLAKVAIASLYDTFEDSEPITTALSNKLGYTAIKKKTVTLDAGTYVEKMIKIGDHVSIGDSLITFDSSRGDPEVQKYLDNLRKGLGDAGLVEELVEANNTIVKASTTGEIMDIKITTTVPVEDLSPSLQKIVNEYHKRIGGKDKFLNKYKNPGDNQYFKCGQLLSETTDVVETKFGKVKGEQVGDGVLIEFYIKHHDLIKKGDKMTKKK